MKSDQCGRSKAGERGIYGLLIRREISMYGFWPSFFYVFCSYGPRRSRGSKTRQNKSPISIMLSEQASSIKGLSPGKRTLFPDFKPKRTRYESVNYGISNY